MRKPSYIIHNEFLQRTYSGIMESGILYALDNENNKVALRDLDWDNFRGFDLCVISCAERFGFAEIQSGRIVHTPQWEYALSFFEKITLVKADGKFGYIDRSGRYVIQPEWDQMSDIIYNGLILVCRNKKWGFVNEIGEIVIPLEWDMVEDTAFSHEMTTHWDIAYDCKGTELNSLALDFPWYDEAHQEVLPAAVLRDGKWGFIDMHGKVVVEPQFDTLEVECIPLNRTVTRWSEDKTGEMSRAVTLAGYKASGFSGVFNIDDKTVRLTACPMYICLKRKSRWYRVQMGVDGKISVIKGKRPKKNKDIQEGMR